MNVIIICGPPAVGKMTVGKTLAELLDYKLFHNHMSSELVNQFFEWSTPPFKRLDRLIRFGLFEEVAKSDLKGFIFTFVWAYNLESDENYVNEIVQIFEKEGNQVHFVELSATLEERLKRNTTPDRLEAKPSKRNIEFSRKLLLQHEREHTFNTKEGEFPEKKILRINNTQQTPKAVATQIKEHFQLN